MLHKKRGFVAFALSITVHLFIFGVIILTLNKVPLKAANKTVILLKTIKIEKPKIKKPPVVRHKKTKPKPKPLAKPKTIKKPKNKPVVKPKLVKKPKPKHIIKHRTRPVVKRTTTRKPHIKPIVKKVKPKQISNRQPSKKPVIEKPVYHQLAAKRPQTVETAKAKYLKINFSKILKAINDAKFYPRKARMLDIEGDVKVEFILRKDGKIKIIKAITNKRFLKQAAVKIVQMASADFPKPPDDIDIGVTIKFRLDE